MMGIGSIATLILIAGLWTLAAIVWSRHRDGPTPWRAGEPR
jgi:hypothetical protein